jgi:hypothetical protein
VVVLVPLMRARTEGPVERIPALLGRVVAGLPGDKVALLRMYSEAGDCYGVRAVCWRG